MTHTTASVVQVDDPWGDFAHCYVRLTTNSCILIDTGCGIGNIMEYINKHINRSAPDALSASIRTTQIMLPEVTEHEMHRKKRPFLVICTHSHFDHVGSNHLFSDPSMQVCFGANDKALTLASRCECCCCCCCCRLCLQKIRTNFWLLDS